MKAGLLAGALLASPPVELIADDFNRADTATDLGTDWDNDSVWRITSNQARLTGTASSPIVRHVTAMPGDDHWVQGTIIPPTVANDDPTAIIARHTVAGGFYAIEYRGLSHDLVLTRGTSITATTTLDTANAGGAAGSANTVRLEVEGSDLRGHLWNGSSWTLILSATDSTYTTGTRVGISGRRLSGACFVDDFKAGTGYLP